MIETQLRYDEVDKRVSAFLADLERICDEHGIKDIWGCGCCGSPTIEVEEEDHEYENLGKNRQGRFSVRRMGVTISEGDKFNRKVVEIRKGFDITKDGVTNGGVY